MPIHPASFRNEIIAAARMEDIESGESSDYTDGEVDTAVVEGTANGQPSESSPLLGKKNSNSKQSSRSGRNHHRNKSLSNGGLHDSHNHKKPRDASGGGGHGHSHGDLNMRGVFLHVMGDALGNIGVIASALFIWLTKYSWRFYSDPLISLIITVIILCSAIPLCKAASRILLQAVPAGLSVDDIKQDITDLPDVVSCHHLHVWQLSDTKLVASLHVQVAFEFKGEGSQRYMQLARQIRKCLHEYGIHSSTIQPEFCCEATHGHRMIEQALALNHEEGDGCDSSHTEEDADICLLDCEDECGEAKCCPGDVKKGCAAVGGSGTGSSASGGSNGKDHAHDHDGHGHAH
jgi:zinc transporter 1